jgi:NTP pyrophosphatase (non-canonical NTP hydrolase)
LPRAGWADLPQVSQSQRGSFGGQRGDKIEKKQFAHEIGDIMTYLSLLADNLDIDMEAAIIEKFNIVSKRWRSKYKL